MRLTSLLAIALFLAAAPTYADTILVGSDLSTLFGGSGLCPSSSDCEEVAQEFTLLTPVVIDQIKVAISGPNVMGSTDGNFNVTLGDVLGTGTEIGPGDLIFNDKEDLVTEVFDFTGLDMSLGAGTYYLQLSGGNVQWVFADPLTTTAGTIGPAWLCDPTISCSSEFWESVDNIHAFEIDGTTSTIPEPSSFILLGTGVLCLAGVVRRRLLACS